MAQEESNRQTHLLIQEIESHRQTDEALQQAKRVADQANQAESRYISAISHELRTPLNSILGYAQLMGEDAGIPPHRKQAVSVIKRGGEHLLSLIEGTLDIARIEAGKLTLNVRPMQFADSVHDVAGMFELQAAARGLRFVFETDGNVPELVRADEQRARQVLINLLGNAVKFTASEQVTFRVRHAREMAHIGIEDTGPGMSEAELEKIFEPFARGSTTGQSVGGASGAGLGLTIAKMLTDLMGGEMTVASTPAKGSVFRIRLFPSEVHLAAGSFAATKVWDARRRPQGYEGARRKLLVDNEEPDRELLVQLLAPMDFELRTAASGHDCLDLLAAGYRPDVIFMDLAMAGIDGWETLRRVRLAGHAGVRLAVVSANAFDKGIDDDVGIRTEDFILKPVRHTELMDWLERNLTLRWLYDAPLADSLPNAAAPAPCVKLDAIQLASLLEVVSLGFYRGILNKLAEIEIQQPASAAFVEEMRLLVRQFRFEAIASQLTQKESGHEQDA